MQWLDHPAGIVRGGAVEHWRLSGVERTRPVRLACRRVTHGPGQRDARSHPSGDLKSMMPAEIAGVTMTIEPASDSAQSFLILWNDEQVSRDLLAKLGAAEGDIDVVFSYGDTQVGQQLLVTGYRVIGSDGRALRDGMFDNYVAFFDNAGAPFQEATDTIAGKEVRILSQPGAPPGSAQHFYGVGDIVFVVSATPDEWVAEALSLLP